MYYFKRRKRVMKEFQKCCEKNAQQAQRAGLMVKDYSEIEKRLNILLMMVDRCWGDLEGIKNELEEIFYDDETGELDEAKFTDSSDLSENAYDEIEECIHDIEYIYEDLLPSIEANLKHSLKNGAIWSWCK